MLSEELSADTAKAFPGLFWKEHTGRELTTFGTGGRISRFAEIQSLDALRFALSEFQGKVFRVIGGGSNVVIADAGCPEPVIRLGKPFSVLARMRSNLPCSTEDELRALFNKDQNLLEPVETVASLSLESEVKVFLGADVPLMSASRKLSEQGLRGLEFGAGIPARIGGAVAMNAGAHGASMADSLLAVWVMNAQGKIERLEKKDCGLGYRHSRFKQSSEVVLGAEIQLYKAPLQEVKEKRRSCLEYRQRTQPLSYPSVGSVFTNPAPDLYAASLIQQVGLRGKQYGGVCFSPMHANWLIRFTDNAHSADLQFLMQLAQEQVATQCGVSLRPEVEFWG